jgi:hypothetical protein
MGRAGDIGAKQMTCDSVKNAVYVVPTDEVDRYVRSLARKGDQYQVLPCEAKGIAAVRQWIGQCAKTLGEDKFCMMDDDLYFSQRIDEHDWHLRPCDVSDVSIMLEEIEYRLNTYAHVSVSPRDVNSRHFMDGCTPETGFLENKRTLRLLAYQTDAFLSVEHGRVPVMEDFDVNLQLLESGRKNCLLYYWANDQRGTGSKGGCSSYRTLEAHNAAAEKLASLHPGFVQLREKETKSSSKELRVRKEVTIAWVKAWESSQ